MIRRFASWGYLAAAGALLIVAGCGSDAEATTTPASVIQPAATLPPLFPIAEEVRKVEEGEANNWTDRQQLTHTPAERVRDRKEIFQLEQNITNMEAKITGLGFQLRRAHRQIDQAENRLGGYTNNMNASQRTVERLETEISRIDGTLNTDIETRAQRVLDHGPDVSLAGSYGISRRPSKADDLTVAEWSITTARAEQHHHAWKGVDLGDRYSPAEWAYDTSTRNLASSIRQLERTINPPSPSLGHDFGISM